MLKRPECFYISLPGCAYGKRSLLRYLTGIFAAITVSIAASYPQHILQVGDRDTRETVGPTAASKPKHPQLPQLNSPVPTWEA